MRQKINTFKNLVQNKTPEGVYNYLMQTNPDFKKFMNDTKGKSVEDIALEYDIDLDLIKNFM